MKNLSVWYRLFIVFIILWTIFSIFRFVAELNDIGSRCQLEIDTIDKSKDIKTQKYTEDNLSVLESGFKKDARDRFLFYWIVPIVLVYASGWITGWIDRGFRRKKQPDQRIR